MTDIFDRATEVEQLQRELAIAQQRREALAQQKATSNPDADCSNCGDSIPLSRRSAVPGCTRCIECEQAAEVRNKLTKR